MTDCHSEKRSDEELATLMNNLGESARTKPIHEVLRDILQETGYEQMLNKK